MTTTVKLGVAFQLNGQDIALNPKEAISEIKAKGMELTLPEKLHLGEAGAGIDSILESFNSEWRTKAKNAYTGPGNEDVKSIKESVPDFTALTATYDKVITAELYIEKFHVKIPGSEAKAADPNVSTKYTVALSAVWPPDSSGKDSSGLNLTGIYLEVSNE